MSDKISAILSRIEDIISKLNIEPLKELFEKLGLGRLFSKEISKRFVATAFLVIVLIVGAVSLVTVLSQRKDPAVTESTAGSEITGQEGETAFASSNYEDFNGNFLLLLNDDDSDDVHLISVVNVDSAQNSLRFVFLNKNATCTVNEFSGTLSEHYKNGGMVQLVSAVEKYADISVKRYLAGDEENFEALITSLPNINVNIKEQVEHSHHGIGFIIEKGNRDLTPSMFLKYFLYLCSQDNSRSVAELMVTLGINLFPPENDAAVQKNAELLTGSFETDISAVDLLTHSGALKKMTSQCDSMFLGIELGFEKFR